jgi:hypothetical protein
MNKNEEESVQVSQYTAIFSQSRQWVFYYPFSIASTLTEQERAMSVVHGPFAVSDHDLLIWGRDYFQLTTA